MSYYHSRVFQFVPMFSDGSALVFDVSMSCAVRRGPSFIFERSSLLPRVERCCRSLGACVCVVFGSCRSCSAVPVCVALFVGGVLVPLWFGSSAVPSLPSPLRALVGRAASVCGSPVPFAPAGSWARSQFSRWCPAAVPGSWSSFASAASLRACLSGVSSLGSPAVASAVRALYCALPLSSGAPAPAPAAPAPAPAPAPAGALPPALCGWPWLPGWRLPAVA